ncbi:Glycine receptor subunit alpha-3 [Halotydeus destructor]|nr:Glycine receptor subunit alpha-3 [Halotydeus destructor]
MDRFVVMAMFAWTLVILCGAAPSNGQSEGVPLPPRVNNTPITIKVYFHLDNLGMIDIRNMDYRVDYYMTETWDVPLTTCAHYMRKLKSADVNTTKDDDGAIFISPDHVHMLWAPDTYIANAKSIDMPSSVMSFSKMKMTSLTSAKQCTMEHASKLTARVSCQMELRNYPYDSQTCNITLRSFSFSSELVKYTWKRNVTQSESLTLQRYKIAAIRSYGFEKFQLTAPFSQLCVQLTFEREMAHSFVHTYAPSMMLVSLSWFSLWMGLDAVPGRITLSVTSLLALVTQFSSLRKEMPPVAYINGSDLWMVVCMVFVFSSLMEFSVVKFMDHQFKKQLKKLKSQSKATRRPSCLTTRFRKWTHLVPRDPGHGFELEPRSVRPKCPNILLGRPLMTRCLTISFEST